MKRALGLVLFLFVPSFPQVHAAPPVEVTVTPTAPNEHQIVLESILKPAPQAVWKALTDYDHHAEFMPYISKSRVTRTSASDLIVEQEGKIRVLFWTYVLRVTQQVTRNTASEETRFHAVEGDFKRLEGIWRLQPEARPGAGTHLVFNFRVEPKRQVPGWAVRFVAKRYLTRMVKALGDRAGSFPL